MRSCQGHHLLVLPSTNNGEYKISSPTLILHRSTCTTGSQYFVKRSCLNTSTQTIYGIGKASHPFFQKHFNFHFFLLPHITNTYFMHRYEWQSRGSAHIHGFMWLPNAPDMKTLDWENATEVHNAKDFFDQFISTWNTWDNHQQAPFLPHSVMPDPCLLSTDDILKKTLFMTIHNYSIASNDT